MGAKDFFKNQTGLLPPQKGAVKDNLNDSLVDVESPAHTEEKFEEREYLLPDIDYSDPANFVRYGLAYEYYNNAFERIQKQYPYDGSAAEQLAFYNDLTPLEKYIYDEKYPKYNGHVTLGLGDYEAGAATGFGLTTNPQYIRFYGGPHEGNVVDSDVGQENNLHLDLEDGVSVEFWLKKNGVATAAETQKESLLNIRNEADTQRFYIYIDRTQTSRIYYQHQNWNGAAFDDILNDYFDLGSVVISDDTWRHLAFSFKKQSGNSVKAVCYINGQQVDTNTNNVGLGAVYTITGSVVGTINGAGGSDDASPDTNAVDDEAGYGKPVSASYDEFRIWKTERDGKQIGLNWFRHVYGGTNTDKSKYYYKSDVESSKVDLAVYFKFNEGIISSTGAGTYDPGNEVTSSTAIGDNLVIDYSGRISNGVFIGYDSTLSMRSENSAIVLARAADSEHKDPLLFTENADYSSALTPLLTSGSNHDVTNQTALYNNIPQWIRDDDLTNGSEIKKLLQIIGSYFDTMHAQIEHVKKFREAEYISSTNKTTDYVSSLLKAHGFNVPELFVDPDVLSSIFDQDEKRIFEEKLYNLKNKVYKNIYSNLTAIYKAKGTEKGFRNLFRCYGTDDELFKINLYADGVEYEIDDKAYDTLVKKRLVDFSGFVDIADRDAVIYQGTSTSGEFGYYPSASNENIPFTIEAQIVFPNKPDIPSLVSVPLLDTASLFGVHSASLSHTDTTIPASGDCDFQVQTRRDSEGYAQFVLTSSTGFFPTLTSSFFYDEEKLVYDDIPWNLAVRLYPKEYPFSSFVTASQNFTLNFYGIKTYLGETLAEFETTETISHASASQFLTGSNKRFYIGSDRVNITGSVTNKSDVKFARFMLWNSYLTNDEITKHSRNPKNYGLSNPYHNAFTYESEAISASYIPHADTLALNWEFDTLTTHNGTSLDSTSGSTDEAAKYPIDDFSSYNGQNYPGVLRGFSTSNDSTSLELMQAEVIQRPDALYGKNFVRIKNNDFEAFEVNKKPVKFFFAFEASHNEVISRDMLNFFSDVISFNNLYGAQVHQYRDSYKELESFKRFYFDKVDDVADLDKFVNLYKFLDNALDSVIKNLVPASAATSEKIRTLVEDHVLDRHKYKKPYPLLLQGFEEDINDINKFPDEAWGAVPLKVADVDSSNVNTGDLIFPERDYKPSLNTNTLTKVDLSRDRLAGVGLDERGQRLAQSNVRRVGENSRLGVAAGSTIRRYGYSVLRQEKDRGDLLVGNTSVDTNRTNLDIVVKARAAKLSSVPYIFSYAPTQIYGIEKRREDPLFKNTFADTDNDGFKVNLIPFPLEEEFVSDIQDDSLYGRREYQISLESRSDNSIFVGHESLPKDVKILSASTDLYSLSPERNFEIEYVRHDSSIASVGSKTKNITLFANPNDRVEKFSLSLAASVGLPVDIYFTSPQITADSFGTFTHNTAKPTALIRERESSLQEGFKSGYNWDGKSAKILTTAPAYVDSITILRNPDALTYNVVASTYIQNPITSQSIYDRIAVSRSIDENDDAVYRVVDRGIFRDRTDIETEQLSPNANLNYKNLIIKRAYNKALATPLSGQGPFYRNIGSEIGVSIHTAQPNPRLVVDPIHTQSFNVEYDNAFIQRAPQNNYDQRWYRKANLVRLNETNNAPYINRYYRSAYSAQIGNLVEYTPLVQTYYDESEVQTIPRDEEQHSTLTFGSQNVDFSSLSIVANRDLDVDNRLISTSTNNYINPSIAGSIDNSVRLHTYLVNSSGPYQYSLASRRLNHASSLLNNPRYKNSFSYAYKTKATYESVNVVNVGAVSSKGRTGKVIIETENGDLAKTTFDIIYGPPIDYFNESSNTFFKLPKIVGGDIFEYEQNRPYKTIFSDEGKELNGHSVKYFSFGEQIFPRRQRVIQILDHYEIDTDYLLVEGQRKVSTTINSLGRSFTSIVNITDDGFSSWSTETFALILDGSDVNPDDGELVQLNYDEAYTDFAGGGSPTPYADGYYNQTFGYRINHVNRNDTSVPAENREPYKSYYNMVGSTTTSNPTMGIIAEYRAENSIDQFLQGGCANLSSEPSLFGYDYSNDSKKLLGLASYSDEMFEFKDIHKQIDKY